MKRIIIRESQYKRLVKQRLNEQKIVFKDSKDEYDVTNEMMQLLIHLKFYIDTIANKDLYIDKVENGIVYIDSTKYTKEEKDLINKTIDEWISFSNINTDKRAEDLTYNFGTDTDWDDLHPTEDIAVVDNTDNSTTNDIDLEDNSTAEIEEEVYDVSDIKACKWGTNSKGVARTVVLPSDADLQFYKDVITGVGGKPTCEKMLFFFAWADAEDSDSSFNPFATTYKDTNNECCYANCLKGGVGYKPIDCRTCPEGTSPGVRNYKTKSAGKNATINTIKARYYPNILSKLKNDNTTAMDLANETSELAIWGTGSLPKQVLMYNKKIDPKAITQYDGKCGAVIEVNCELTVKQLDYYNENIKNNEDNLNFRDWVNKDSSRLEKVNKRLTDCGLSDPKLDKVGGMNQHLKVAFTLLGKDWVNAGKPVREVVDNGTGGEEHSEDSSIIYETDPLLTYSKRAAKDRDKGIINPTLIKDIIKALRSIGMPAEITYAREGHGKHTNSGTISRHWKGQAVDISVINGEGNPDGKASNGGIGKESFIKNGDKIVKELEKLGYGFGERGKDKGYLWKTSIGGNHYNHIHVSKKTR